MNSVSADGPRRAVVVTFDQLPASILGCYGNEWIETPHLDRLAANGIVADHCWPVRVGPASADDVFAASEGLHRLKDRGVRSLLIREADSQIDFPEASFDAVETLHGEHGSTAKPDCIPLAALVRAAQADSTSAGDASRLVPSPLKGERARQRGFEPRDKRPPLPDPLPRSGGEGTRPSRLVWLHARGLTIPAAPPAGFAELYQDEFEDRGVKFDDLPETERQFHPLIAAGMMSLFDHWLGELLQTVIGDETPLAPMLLIVTAAQGSPWQPLPNSFGPLEALRGQSVQPPLILQATHDDRFLAADGLRCRELLSTAEVGPLLEWWFGVNSEQSWLNWVAQQSQSHQDCIVTRSTAGPLRCSTTEWGAIFPAASDETTKPALFHKPEDTWEVNNVAEMFPDVVDRYCLLRSANDECGRESTTSKG